MSGADGFLPERDPDRWHPPDGIADSLRPIAMYAQPVAHGLEVVLLGSEAEPLAADIRQAWSKRRAERITPVLLVVFYLASDEERVSLFGPVNPMMYRAVEVSRAEQLTRAALGKQSHHAATHLLNKELPELGTPVAGLRTKGLLTGGDGGDARKVDAEVEILTKYIPRMPEWEAAVKRAVPLLRLRGSTLVEQLGYSVESLGTNTKILTTEEDNLAVWVFCNENEPFDDKAVRFGGASPTSFALMIAKEQKVDWALLTRSSEIRLCSGKKEGNQFVEINLDLLPSDQAGYLDLMFSAKALKENGTLSKILNATTRITEPTEEVPMTNPNKESIGCMGGEIIVLGRHSEEITLSIDKETVRLSKKAASRMVEWLNSQINDLDSPPVSPPGDGPSPNNPTPSRYGTKVLDLIQSGFLEAETLLTLTYKRRKYYAKVNSNGSLEVDGSTFPSPSTACVHATGQVSCNGWVAWKDHNGHTLAYLRSQLKRMQSDDE